ncbi:MAG: right-handed parallel beta-helix repeat-containing protein [Candidatus Bipolaricaulota bacterium]|nr:right-handed parallel beta-helix repeat-containing protein [Candidatus Bipolaricaulota bacterium]
MANPLRGAVSCGLRLFGAAGGVLLALLTACAPRPGEGLPCRTLRPEDSIQHALDEAPPGAVICLARGTWTETLVIRKPVTLRGAGPTRTVIRGRELAQPVLTVGSLDPDGAVVLQGIALAGAAGSCATPGGCAHGLLVTGSATVQVEDCAFSRNAGCGVAAEGQARVSLQHCTIQENVGHGVLAHGEAEVVLTAVTVAGGKSAGIWLAGEARLTLTSSTVRGCEGHGAWVRDRSTLIASQSTISDCGGHGLWVRDGASAELSGCTIARARDAGARVEGAARLALSSSTVTASWYGVEARDSASVTLTQTTVADVRWDGVRAQGRARLSVASSTLRKGTGTGVRLEGTAQAELQDNRIEGWNGNGVLSLSQSPPTGSGNRMAGNGVDLVGNLPGELRAPLRSPSEELVRFPSRAYPSLQEAIDALLPGGRLLLSEGTYPAGVTVGKPLQIEGEGVVLLTAQAARETPVMSLVGGANLRMVGVSLGYGSEGLILGADARAELVDCVLSDNSRGIHASDTAEVALLRCRLSRNSQGGMGVWNQSRARVLECVLTDNAVFGIGVGDAAQLELKRSLITESGWNGGLILRDRGEARIEENAFLRNHGVGVALYHGRCLGAGFTFRGRVTGGANSFAENYKGDTCPAELAFLAGEGGELDWRR